MFGYLQVEKGELRVREYEQYKAVYCTLCKQLGKDYSIFTRFILSYDMTLFALLSLSLENRCTGFKKGRCTCNPLKKCTFCKEGGKPFEKAAALSVITAYYKVLDDIDDGSFLKKLCCKIVKPFFKRQNNKASKKFPEYAQSVEKMWLSQKQAEKNPDCHIDMAAEPTACMMKEIFSLEAKTDEERLILSEMGYQLGRWVYLIDAADDIEDDIKTNSFNPLKNYYDSDREKYKENVLPLLNQCLANVYSAFNLLELKYYAEILDNLFYLGLNNQQKNVLEGKNRKEDKKNEQSV